MIFLLEPPIKFILNELNNFIYKLFMHFAYFYLFPPKIHQRKSNTTFKMSIGKAPNTLDLSTSFQNINMTER